MSATASIYNIWRQVLDYFDAFLIGLTATPTAQTIGFFNGNLVQDYTHEQAVADGVNVGYDVYRIETKITTDGAKLAREPGVFVPHRDRRTKGKKYKELDDDLTYTANQLDRDVVAENQIRLVIRTFRDKLPEIFPGRTEVPKTLVFAKTDLHAEDIVRIIREEFGKGNDFCQKITSKTTGKKPEDLLAEFRNTYYPPHRRHRGHDRHRHGREAAGMPAVHAEHPVAVLLRADEGARLPRHRPRRPADGDARRQAQDAFRHRGCGRRVRGREGGDEAAGPQAVRAARQDAGRGRRRCRRRRSGLDAGRPAGPAGPAARRRSAGSHRQGGRAARHWPPCAPSCCSSIDPDVNTQQAVEKFSFPPDQEPTEKQLQQVEQERMRAALKPFHNPKLRNAILAAKGRWNRSSTSRPRTSCIRAGFDAAALEKARSMLTSFRQFIEDNKDEIEALKVLYSRPYRAGLRTAR